jgi:MoaA/NifB/PqqE/SkfB family radical SAM enzyme
MDWKLFCKVVDDLLSYPKLKLVSLMLQNEPLLGKNLYKEINYVKNKNSNLETSISTNGFYLTSDVTSKLVDAGLDRLIFSINGLTKESFEKIEKGLDYNIIFSNLMALIENKPSKLKIIVKCMLIRDNIVEFVLPEKFSNLPKLLKSNNIPLDIGPISNRAGSLMNYDDIVVYEHLQSSKDKKICDDIFTTINVLYTGEMISCCADWNRESVLGNLKRHKIEEILLSPEVKKRKGLIKNGKYNQITPCKNCSQAKNIMANLC